MKLIAYFNDFLNATVDLDTGRLERLNGSVGAITSFLEHSQTFADHFLATIPQGSYAHKTIIRPVHQNDEFDADMLLFVQEFDDWSAADYVENLYACFRNSGTYRDKVSRRTRCVTINYSGDFHMDVVPYLERHGEKYVTNRHEDVFQRTDPEAYNSWLDEKNRVSARNLVKVIRLVKYLRDYKRTFDVKSIILNVMLGEQVNSVALLSDPGCYADVPTTLRTVMNRLSAYVEERPYLPSIIDPSGTGENFSDRWNQDGYASFRTCVMRYAEWIEDAWSDPDPQSSLEKWQRVFGSDFQKNKEKDVSESLVKSQTQLSRSFQDTEQNLADIGISYLVNPAYRFRIEGKVLRKGSMGAYYLRDRGNKVLRNRRVRFQVAECNVPEPFRIYWKVKNRGEQAFERNCIRGQIHEGTRQWGVDELTSFTGPHFVECYIVKDGVCVATDRQEVNII